MKPTESNGLRGLYKGGKRITSLFKEKSGLVVHADINGAVNILQKYLKHHVVKYYEQICSPVIMKNDFAFLNFLRQAQAV